jgi:hypothetical protein
MDGRTEQGEVMSRAHRPSCAMNAKVPMLYPSLSVGPAAATKGRFDCVFRETLSSMLPMNTDHGFLLPLIAVGKLRYRAPVEGVVSTRYGEYKLGYKFCFQKSAPYS